MPGSKSGAAQAVAAVSNIVRLVPSESQGARKQICLDAIAVAAETITTEWPAAGKKAAHIVICIGGFDADGAAHNTYIVGACNAFEAVGLLAITQSDLITNP